MTPIRIPDFSLVVLIGASGSGKSSFARTHFLPTEVVSSDFCRGLVSDDENDQSASDDAFAVLHTIVARRLARMKLTVVDATNVQPEARRQLLNLAREYHALPVAIVLDLPANVCIERNRTRPDRTFGPHVVNRQRRQLKGSLRGLGREGFRRTFILRSEAEIAATTVEREPLWNNRAYDTGPFDIIGDVHGCYDELGTLLDQLGYRVDPETHRVTPPEGRKLIFLGDLVDRGPKIVPVLKLVMGMVEAETALCIPGNHDVKLLRKLNGRNVQVSHGMAETLAQFADEPKEFHERVAAFIDALVSHYVLDQGRLVVAHAGMKESMAGRASGAVRNFALFGETTGETDEFGLPVRHNWAAEYRGRAAVVYGHTPVPEPEWFNNTINIDTGCVFGGALTALRYPERELISVPAQQVYAEPARPFLVAEEAEGAEEGSTPALSAQQRQDDLLDITDVLVLDASLGKRFIDTRLAKRIQIRAENAAAALEVMSRFAVNPKWLVYLPPTMSPTETSALPDLLEHPHEAFAYYREMGVPQVICEEKHMGSRAVVVLCRDEDVARRRFGVLNEGIGIVYTRTGRRFFIVPHSASHEIVPHGASHEEEGALETELLDCLREAATRGGLWDALATDWLVLDCELMPWSAKAQGLLRGQYAAVRAAASAAFTPALTALESAAASNPAAVPLLERYRNRAVRIAHYADAYRRYCWEVRSLADLRLAPFHLLASEGRVHADKNHLWHLEMIARLRSEDGTLLHPTQTQAVDVNDEASVSAAVRWWEELTERGGEGMVVKPLDFIATGARGLIQPAVKVRGREYLRIIYGPEYDAPEHIRRLRARGLGAKRGLALRELALGIEALERFVRGEPLRRVHECVFGVLALESEPIDPRL